MIIFDICLYIGIALSSILLLAIIVPLAATIYWAVKDALQSTPTDLQEEE